jgi:trans-aconitate methyltransferase
MIWRDAVTGNGLAAGGEREPWPEIDTTTAHAARVYDYWLGGGANFAVDRQAAEQAIAAMPMIVDAARANRAFLGRAVRYLAGEAGIRQFLDLGTGIPTQDNVHQVAQRVVPQARIVYVDNDPIVLAHAHELVTSAPEGAAAYLYADMRDPEKILAGAAKTLEFSKPAALMLLAALQLVSESDNPYGLVARLVDALAPGSYLAISHPAGDVLAESGGKEAADALNRALRTGLHLRTREQVLRFFDGLDLVEPGLVQVHQWRPGAPEQAPGRPSAIHCAVARKP